MRPKIPFAVWSLGALVAGMGLGSLAHAFPAPPFDLIGQVAQPVGTLFVTAIQGTVLPLIVALLLNSLLNVDASTVGALGGRTLVAMTVALLLSTFIAIPVAPALLALMPLDPELLTSLRQAVVPTTSAGATASTDWAAGLFPRNVVQAAAANELVQILIFTIAFGLAASRLPDNSRRPLANLAAAVNATMLKLIGWVIAVSPICVFALAFTTSRAAGVGVIGVGASFVVIATVLIVILGVVYYGVGAYGARVSVLRFAQAVLPSQVVAFSTRSSLATVPSLVDAARNHLRLPDAAAAFVVPLCAASFRASRAMVSTGRLFLLAHVYGVQLTPMSIGLLAVGSTVTSFTFAGVPLAPTNALRNAPLYVAAGIPVEGIILLDAVETLIDHVRTTINVTANLALAALLTRPSAVVAESTGAPATA
jgi:proton glutamate symport protein